MKYVGYILRNAARNPLRSALTIGSMSITLFLMMFLISFIQINAEVGKDLRQYNRLISISSQGFASKVPISTVNEVRAMADKGLYVGKSGIPAVSPFSWYGGKIGEERTTFAQFGVDPQVIFEIYQEIALPEDQLKAFRETRTGCVIGRKLAEDRNLKLGDRFLLNGDIYPVDLDMTVVGIYDGDKNTDLRMCMFNWEYLNELLKASAAGSNSADNAGSLIIKCKNAASVPVMVKAIDDNTKNSEFPTRTQTEDAFIQIFAEMLGDLRYLILLTGMAVVFSLLCVAGVAMAMAMRERTTEVAVLKAIGFQRGTVLGLLLTESVLIAIIGGLVGGIGTKLLFDVVDISKFTGNFLPFFFVPWWTALLGLGVSAVIGLISGIIPATLAARTSVIDGLRKVV